MAVATGNNIPPFAASQGNLSYIADISSTSLAGSLAAVSAVTDRRVIMVKNITVTPPKEEAEIVQLLGQESTTIGNGVLFTGSFQNAIFDVKAASAATMSGTMVLTLANDGTAAKLPDFLEMFSGTTGQAISATHHRRGVGDSTATQTRQLTGGCFLELDNGDRAGVVAFINPIVSWGDIKIADGASDYEVDFELTSLPKDWAIEVEDKDS